MKLKISKEKLNALIKEEAMKLKFNKIQESAADSKVKLLENKLAKVEQEMRDVYKGQNLDEHTAATLGITQEQDIEEIFGMGKYEKAKKEYKQIKSQELAQLTQAYKARTADYVEISKGLLQTLRQDSAEIAKRHGITDVAIFYKDLQQLAQPMDFNTFNRQAAKGGAGLKDFVSGARSGQGGDFGV